MPARHRALPVTVATVLLVACASGGAGNAPRATEAGRPPPTGVRTVVERQVGDAAMVVEVLEGPGAAAATWTVVHPAGTREPTLVAEEMTVGDDHYVHMAAADGGPLEAAVWVHFDLTDPRQAAWLEQHPVGLIASAALWDAGVGAPIGSDTVVGVEGTGDGRRVLRLADGLDVVVRREVLRPAPVLSVPDTLPVVAFHDLDRLVDDGG